LLACLLSLTLIGTAMTEPIPVASPHKNRTAKIAFVYPFDLSAISMPLNLGLNPFAYIAWDVVLRYINNVNADDSILPGLKLELIMKNTVYDRGQSLLSTLAASDEGAVAVIGEASSKNSVVVALAAATKNMLHCLPLSATMDLARKADYPYSFRTTVASYYAAQGVIDLLLYYNRSDVLIISSNDEFGSDAMATVSSDLASHNISVKALVQFPPGLTDYSSYVETLLKGKSVTILMIVYTDSPNLSTSLYNAGAFDGKYLVVSYGFSYNFFTTPAQRQVLSHMEGLFVVMPWTPGPNETPLSAEIYKWWMSLQDADGKPILETNSTQNLCNLTLPGSVSCYKGTNYATGYLNTFYKATGAKVSDAWNSNQYYAPHQCIDVIVKSLDYWMKNGTLSIDDILNKKSLTKTGGNIANMMNAPQIPDFWNTPYKFDKNGDVMPNTFVTNLQITPGSGVVPVPVGWWFSSNRSVVMGSTDIRFFGNLTSPPVAPPIPVTKFAANMAVRYAFDGVIALCALMTLFCTAYMVLHIKEKIFKASSPVFLGLISCGALISYVSIFLFSQYPMTGASCIIYVWLKYLGFSFVFGALLVKTYRIHAIFSSKKRKGAPLKDGIMFGFFLCIIAIWCTILIIYTLIPSQRPILALDQTVQIDEMNNVVGIFETPHCNFQTYNYVCLGAMVFTLALGAGLTYLIRNTPSAFNESKWISMATYNWVVIGVVLSAVTNFAVHDPDIIFIMEALMITITQGGVIAMMFMPKIISVARHEVADPSTLTGLMTTSSSGITNQSSARIAPNQSSKAAVSMTMDGGQPGELEALKSKLQASEAKVQAYAQKFGKL
ncbi:hypothetical protein HK101_000575, partial [Irineochytrium annulatum]